MMAAPLRPIALAAALALAIGVMNSGVSRAEHKSASPAQAEIEGVVHQYLLEHPEVILEAVEVLRARERAATTENARAQITAQRETIINDPTSPVAGNPDGDVTLVEFFDYHCGYCKRVMPSVLKLLDEDSGIRLVYKEFPILGPQSVTAARAALAAHMQDEEKYLEFHVAMMSSRARLTEDRVLQMAREMGFNIDRLKADMSSPEVDKTIARNLELAQKLGITGTPRFVIGDQIVPGAVSLETLKELVRQARTS